MLGIRRVAVLTVLFGCSVEVSDVSAATLLLLVRYMYAGPAVLQRLTMAAAADEVTCSRLHLRFYHAL